MSRRGPASVVLGLIVATLVATATSAGVSARASGTAAAPPTPVVRTVETTENVVFITIDDGYTRDPAAGETLDRLGWPVTNFVMPRQLGEDVAYFTGTGRRTDFGNHTVNHPLLSTVSKKRQKNEICGAEEQVAALTGGTAKLFRPPGGDHNSSIRGVAASCGITHTVMWSVSVRGAAVAIQGRDEIKAGDIIILHYDKNLNLSLVTLEQELARRGLEPAVLLDHLK